MNLWRFVQRCVVVLLVALQSVTWTSMATALAMANIVVATVGCAATPVAQRYPQARVEKVCVRPPGIEPDAAHWVYADSGAVVSSEHPEVFDRIAREVRSIYEHDQDAEPTSAQRLPYPHNDLVCPERFQPLPQKPIETPDKELGDEALLFADLRERCRRFQEENNPGKAAMYFGQAGPKPYVKENCMVPKTQSSKEQAIAAARGQAQDIGRQFGAAIGYYKARLGQLYPFSFGLGVLVHIKRYPDFLVQIHGAVTEALDKIPALPTYDDPDVAQAAMLAFESGYGSGMADARLEALAVAAGFEILYISAGNLGALAETAGMKAFQVALARVRGMPIFVSGSTTGVGFFLRIPKPPPANANAPSLPIGVASPPAGTPPPFGNLSRAAEFGIQAESSLAKAIAKTGLEKHHLIEQRFDRIMGADPRMKLTIAVTPAEHQEFTNAWRAKFAYGTSPSDSAKVLEAARTIYEKYPAILKALGL